MRFTLDPTVAEESPPIPPAPRLGDLASQRLGFVDNSKLNADLFLSRIAAAQALVNAFEKKYPFISAEAVRASSSKIATRLDAEIEADRVQGDVFEFSLLYLTTSLRKRGEILKYDSPDYAHYPAAYSDPDTGR